MKRSLAVAVMRILCSRAVTPLVIGMFLLIYIAIAFTVEDALTTLIGIVSSSLLLIAGFALIPLNRALMLTKEIFEFITRWRLTRRGVGDQVPELFDETVSLPVDPDSYATTERRLVDAGYTIRRDSRVFAAWQGLSSFPSRGLFLAATVCLFCGILLSLGGRSAYRGNLIEGVPVPRGEGQAPGDVVRRIALVSSSGSLLAKTLTIELAPEASGEAVQTFRLYPPSRYHGAFVYPRYVGVGVRYRILTPEIPQGTEVSSVLNIHPPGKEEASEVPGTPYRLIFSLEDTADGSDPFTTGSFKVQCKLMRGNSLLLQGTAAAGAAVTKDGYRLDILEVRRAVVTDFIDDSGVYLVWLSALLFVLSFVLWLLVRTAAPLREMVFVSEGNEIAASSRAEGRVRQHSELFHELLDRLSKVRH